MSDNRRFLPCFSQSQSFIRPNLLTHIDTSSAAKRLALKGAGFATTDKVTAAIREGVAAELVAAVMAALESRFECLRDEDVRILTDLYTTAPSAVTMTADAITEPEGLNPLAEQEGDTPQPPLKAGGD